LSAKETKKLLFTTVAMLFLSMRIILYTLLLLASLLPQIHAQKTSEEDYATSTKTKETPNNAIPFRDRLVFGGSLGGYFGNPTYLMANPMIGYKTKPWWVNGVGFSITYISSNGYSENMYGASLWSRAYIKQSIIAHSEFELLRREASDQYGNQATVDVPVWLVGAGYNSGGRIGFSAMILYDLIQDPNSPYSNPVFRVGGLFGF
jgi:hypothetical protein